MWMVINIKVRQDIMVVHFSSLTLRCFPAGWPRISGAKFTQGWNFSRWAQWKTKGIGVENICKVVITLCNTSCCKRWALKNHLFNTIEVYLSAMWSPEWVSLISRNHLPLDCKSMKAETFFFVNTVLTPVPFTVPEHGEFFINIWNPI